MDVKKMTAVEWLVEQYDKSFILKVNNVMTSIIEQAKSMEKEQMKDAVLDDVLNENMKKKFAERFEQYYNENYGK